MASLCAHFRATDNTVVVAVHATERMWLAVAFQNWPAVACGAPPRERLPPTTPRRGGMAGQNLSDFGSTAPSPIPVKGSPSPARSQSGKPRRKTKKWVPPIPVREKRRQITPGPGAYNLGWTLDASRGIGQPNWSKSTHGAMSRSGRSQDTRDFYFGSAMSNTSASFGRDSPGPVYQTAGDPGKPFPGPRASQSTAPGASSSGAIQRPFLEPTCSPGPKYLYFDNTKTRNPVYSLGSRNAIPPAPERSPGPTYYPTPKLIGNITQSSAGCFSMTARPYEREKGDEPGPGAFDVGPRQLDASRRRAPKQSIAINFNDRKGMLKVPTSETPGPETGLSELPGCIGSDLSVHGGFNRGPGHADAVMNMSKPRTDNGFTMSMIIP